MSTAQIRWARVEEVADVIDKARVGLSSLQLLRHTLGADARLRKIRLGWRNRYSVAGPAPELQDALSAGLLESVGAYTYRATTAGLLYTAVASGIREAKRLDHETLAALDVSPFEADALIMRLL